LIALFVKFFEVLKKTGVNFYEKNKKGLHFFIFMIREPTDKAPSVPMVERRRRSLPYDPSLKILFKKNNILQTQRQSHKIKRRDYKGVNAFGVPPSAPKVPYP
jgi:hypothetical protein